jgi:potassium/hydrogen antiporter
MKSILLSAILSCTSSAIVIPIVNRMTIKKEIQTILSIESALSDVLAVVLTVSLIEFMQLENIGLRTPFRSIASSFSIATISGVVFGLLWLKILDLFKERKYSYMITLAAVLILFALVKFLGGSGSIAVLIFGIILGNCQFFGRYLKLKSCILVNETIKFFHGEVTFFIRTFFFVYLGIMISFKTLNREFIAMCVSLVLMIVLIRYISVIATGLIYHEKREDRFVMLSMMPRGLASAVLATLPVSANIEGSTGFVDYTFAIIVLTNVLMTFGVFITEKRIQVTA